MRYLTHLIPPARAMLSVEQETKPTVMVSAWRVVGRDTVFNTTPTCNHLIFLLGSGKIASKSDLQSVIWIPACSFPYFLPLFKLLHVCRLYGHTAACDLGGSTEGSVETCRYKTLKKTSWKHFSSLLSLLSCYTYDYRRLPNMTPSRPNAYELVF